MEIIEKNFHLPNCVGAQTFKFSETLQLEAKWWKKESGIFEVELRNLSENCGVENDFKFELETKYSSTIIQKLPDNKYMVTLTVWYPVTVKATYLPKKHQIMAPEFATLFYLELPKATLENLKVNEFFENDMLIFDDVDITYNIRRETAIKYVMDIKSKCYNLRCNRDPPEKIQNDYYAFWPGCIEFEYKKPQFTKSPLMHKESTVTFWFEKDAKEENHKVCISDQETELDFDKVQQIATEKFGAPDFTVMTEDGEIIQTHKKILAEKSKIFENAETMIAYDSKIFMHVLAFVYCNSVEFHGLEMELIKFAIEYEMNDLKDKCIDSLVLKLDKTTICKITKFACENGISTLMKKCGSFFTCSADFGRGIPQEDLQTLTCDMVFKSGGLC